MKKHQITALLLSSILSFCSLSSVSAEEIAPVAPLIAAPETYSVSVNESVLDLKDFIPYISGEQIMIPVRLISEKLGFQVSWNEAEESIHLENGTVHTTVYIGEDSYYMASSTAIGMSAPCSLGAAPELKGNTSYVPAALFQILFCNKDAVQIKDHTIAIISEPQTSTQIPNPIRNYPAIEDALKALHFEAAAPTVLPADYTLSSVDTIADKILQITYANGKSEILYRTAEGSEDISGDYNTYAFTKTVLLADCHVTIKGNEENIFNAIWNKDGKCYSVFAENGLSLEELKTILSGI